MRMNISTDQAAKPKGPYSQAVRAGDFIFVSGQGAVDPEGKVHHLGVEEETRMVLRNIRTILEAAGATPQDVVRCGVFLADINDFAAMNEVYSAFFEPNRPARTTVAPAALPAGITVEIDCIAYRPVNP